MNNGNSSIKLFFSKSELLKNLIIKNFKSRYSNTVLGFLWAALTPLLISIVIAFVFTYITKVEEENFIGYVISGMLPWLCFSASLQESANSLVVNSSVYKQFGIPLIFIPVSYVVINFLNLIIGFIVAMPFFIKHSPRIMLLIFLLPVPLILHFLFTLGLSFIIAALYIRHKDITHILNIFLLFWLWSSPVFYLYDKFPSNIQRVFAINIFIPFLNLYRSIFYKYNFFEAKDLLLSACFSFALFIFGYKFFVSRENAIKKTI